jgi:hypothetical protein
MKIVQKYSLDSKKYADVFYGILRFAPSTKMSLLCKRPRKPGKLSWRSIGGDSDNAGEVIFEPAPGNRGTLVTVCFKNSGWTNWETCGKQSPPQSKTISDRKSSSLQSF